MSFGWLSPWAPLPATVYVRPPRRALPAPLDDERCRVYAYARQGLWHGLRAHGLGAGDAVLVPAYHHGAEVEVLAALGVEARFYEATGDLQPDAAQLEALLDPAVRALYVIHHLGFGQDVARWRRWCDERGLLLLEDVAMAWPAERDGTPLGALADIGIYSPWKLFGLADTGAVTATRELPTAPAPVGGMPAGHVLSHAKWLAEFVPVPRRAAVSAGERAGGLELSGPEYELGDPDAPPTRISLACLRRLDPARAARRRRTHHATLLETLGELVPAPFDRVDPGACPFVFPVAVDAPDVLIDRLRAHGIGAFPLWRAPHRLLTGGPFPVAARRRAHVVALPVHQELRAADVRRIANTVGRLVAERAIAPVRLA